MRKKIKYTDEPMGNVRVITDFLPKPENLVFREKAPDDVEIKIFLPKESLEFLKKEASTRRVDFQVMIQSLLQQYIHSRQVAH